MDLLSIHYDRGAIQAKTQAIYDVMLEQSPNIEQPNFTSIVSKDVAVLFGLYDRYFFDGWLQTAVTDRSRMPLGFRVSSRMTKSGGKTTRNRHRSRKGHVLVDYEITIASRLLLMTFGDIQRPVRIGGLLCQNRLEALQRVMEHEVVHLAELLTWNSSSCKQPRFMTLVGNIFGHTDVRHELVTPHEDASVHHDLCVGSVAEFKMNGMKLTGTINRIHRRATVLVESTDGESYSDGRRYQKYYVPLPSLKALDC